MNPINIDKNIIETAHKRNYSTKLVPTLNIPQKEIDERIKYYYSIPQPPQKSQAWLDQRTNYITASAFGHAIAPKWKSYRNELLKNKVSKGSYNTFHGNEATRWGEKYEDVCEYIYRYRENVTVFGFGLIPHPKYPFLGASTDGITSKLINLEIKSPYSRTIVPGKVKPIYWQQMQLQMAVLDLNLSHFLECTFHEYPSERDFWMDFNYEGLEHPEKGIVIEIVNLKIMNNADVPATKYIYSPIPLCTNQTQLRLWHKQQISKIVSSSDMIYIRSHFWILAVYSCVNVVRDREWFDNQIPKFTEFWEEVQKYRNKGGLSQLQLDIEKNRPKPKQIKVEAPKRKGKSLVFDAGSEDNDLPPGYIMSSSDEEITEINEDDGGGCLMDSSSDEDVEKNTKLNDKMIESIKHAKDIDQQMKDEKKIKKPQLNLIFKNSSSSSNSNSTTCSNASVVSDSDSEDTADSIYRHDPYRERSVSTESSNQSNDAFSYFHSGDESDSEDSIPMRPHVEQAKYFRRYKTKRQANKKRDQERAKTQQVYHFKKNRSSKISLKFD